MRKTLPLAAATIASVLVVGYVAQARAPHGRQATVIHVVEHATTNLVVDTGPTGASSGDLLTFANDVFDDANTEKVGRDQGDCIRINVIEGSWECRWITFLKGGAITVEGPRYDTQNSVLVITGGRGEYKGARGSMELKLLPNLSGYDFIFKVLAN